MAVGLRVSAALWMAIEALETEALALRSLSDFAGDDDGDAEGKGGSALADQAEEDARILRELASKHVPPRFRGRDGDD